jgi:hypothetical protein
LFAHGFYPLFSPKDQPRLQPQPDTGSGAEAHWQNQVTLLTGSVGNIHIIWFVGTIDNYIIGFRPEMRDRNR